MGGTDVISDIIQSLIAIGAIIGITVSILANKKQIQVSESQLTKQLEASEKQLKEELAVSEAQINKQIEESRRLALEDRQHQSRPIIVPQKAIIHNSVEHINLHTGKAEGPTLYTSEKMINWSWLDPIRIDLRNVGNGPAFNLHCVLYGSGDTCQDQFISWDNGPIEEKSSVDIDLQHSSELRLFHDASLSGMHPLFDRSPDSPSNPRIYRIACLTLTYHDLFGKKYVSIFNYTLQHQWIHVVTEEIPRTLPLDLKELNDKKKQGPKLSAPPVKTSQGN